MPGLEKRTNDRKKKRCALEYHDSAQIFNEIGIIHFHAGQQDEALRSFVDAVCAHKKDRSSEVVQLKTIPYSTENEVLIDIARHAACQSSRDIHQHKYKPQEYDEGLNIYTVPLHTSKSLPLKLTYATFIYNIAQIYVLKKKHEEAKSLFEAVLAILLYCNLISDDSTCINIVKVQHNLGKCCYYLGEKNKAMTYYQQALLNINKLDLGKYELAVTYNCVGVMEFHLNSLSDLTNALNLFQLSLSIQKKLFGNCTKGIGTTLNNIGRVRYVRGEFDEALKVYREALKIRRALPGLDLEVAATVFNIGQTHHKRGDLDNAMVFYREFVNLMGSQLGSSNGDIALAYRCMGKLCIDRGDMDNARCLLEKALQSARAAFTPNHPELASILNNVGNLCYKTNDYEAALHYFGEELKIEKESDYVNRSDVIITLENMAVIYMDNGDYDKALVSYKEIYRNQVRESGRSSLEVVSTLSKMGMILYLLNRCSLSLACYERVLKIRRDFYGSDDHVDIASTFNSLGLVLYKLNKYELAKDACMKCVVIGRKLGLAHDGAAIFWHNSATILWEVGEEEQAIRILEELLRLREKCSGGDRSDLCGLLRQLGQMHKKRGEFDDAIGYFGRALDIEKNISGKTSTSVVKLLNVIGNLHLMNGNVEEMMKFYVEASRLEIGSQNSLPGGQPLQLSGDNLYTLSKRHPKCAQVA